MKTRSSLRPLLAFAIVCLLPPSPAAAEGPPDSPAPGRRGAGPDPACAASAAGDDFAALERFLDLGDEQLDRIQRAIARVRAMTPGERAALHAQLHAFRQLPPAQRERVRTGWRDNRDHADWPLMMRSLPEAARTAIQAELQSLPAAERATRKHELLEAWRGNRTAAGARD